MAADLPGGLTMKEQQLSHAQRRAELEAMMAACTIPVRRVETVLNVNCPTCFHQWKVGMAESRDVLVCAKCGNRNPVVAQRDSLRRWSRQRRTR
jgi:hypothetical protein